MLAAPGADVELVWERNKDTEARSLNLSCDMTLPGRVLRQENIACPEAPPSAITALQLSDPAERNDELAPRRRMKV